jgi:[ribosomal protein S18]-alanine N-acetyltransferase
VYERYGFSIIGRRTAYYPAADSAREDAIVMRLPL